MDERLSELLAAAEAAAERLAETDPAEAARLREAVRRLRAAGAARPRRGPQSWGPKYETRG